MAQGSRKISRRAWLAVLGLSVTSAGWTQQTPASPTLATHAAAQEPAATEDSRTAKQKLLADQAQRLVAMAAELKVEVDKTNKNILSLNVVRKAEQIEALAHRMKDQGKK